MLVGNDEADGSDGDQFDDIGFTLNTPYAGHAGSFTSALQRKGSGTRPALRRRGSDTPSRWTRTDHDPWAESTSAHSRSRTLDSSSSTGGTHPLASGSQSFASSTALRGRQSSNDTRPRLKRLLSESRSMMNESGGHERHLENPTTGSVDSGLSIKDEERVVLVHEVLPTDSLAGVALKYGVTLADIRRANQLWTSDSIHMRKVLYIPLEKARQSRQFKALFLGADSPTPAGRSGLLPESEQSPSAATNESVDTADTSNSPFGSLTVLRVPASQLSFFPPPSNPRSSPHFRSSSRTHPRDLAHDRTAPPLTFTTSGSSTQTSSSAASSTSLPRTFTRDRSLLPLPHLSSFNFFSTLPDTVASVARRSFESSSVSASTGSDEHEMEDVSAASSTTKFHPRARAASGSTVVQMPLDRNLIELTPSVSDTAISLRSPRPRNTVHASHRTDAVYSPPDRPSPSLSPAETPVRTAQLQPSPVMQLPIRARRSKSRDLAGAGRD